MFVTARVFFDGLDRQISLYRQYAGEYPEEFVKLYKRNVSKITPIKSGALRRSIITQVLGNQGQISWRMPYAAAQDAGKFTARRTYVANISPSRDKAGPYITIKAGQTYPFTNYTDPSTNSGFATRAFIQTNKDMQAVYTKHGYKL